MESYKEWDLFNTRVFFYFYLDEQSEILEG